METIGVIKRFIESNWLIEKAVRKALERLRTVFGTASDVVRFPTYENWMCTYFSVDMAWSSGPSDTDPYQRLSNKII